MNKTILSDNDIDSIHPIQVVVRRTGLSADVIRAWERRYDAVTPKRSPTSRRLYSDEDVERLLLLRQATQSGRRIGDVARLPLPALKDLLATDQTAPQPSATPASQVQSLETHLATCMTAVRTLDGQGLEAALAEAALVLSTPTLLENIISELLKQIGEAWRTGDLRACHEHLASAQLRTFLGHLANHSNMNGNGPGLLVTTPMGQQHELGALMVTITATLGGWNALYLGPNIPSDEIAFAAMEKGIKVVALSVSYPADDPRLPEALHRLRRQLPADSTLLIGGGAALGYRIAIDEIGAIYIPDLSSLSVNLDQLRNKP
ncbi:MAG: MerR family transcriptional regulator [Candidatus Competibacteraceae bacterium]|jgi:DNA-binding transcriptional MerR regulator|nr:MerR family transcriptional regulator [Candidatus Competibacteraceae bacterium]